jgi:hexulose-6-phosphate isomerase
MLMGANRWCFPAEWSASKVLEAAAAAGFDGIEWNVAEEGALNLQTTSAEAEALAEQTRSAGLQTAGISTALGWKYPLSDPDIEVRRRGLAVHQHCIRTAAAFGVDSVLVVPGVVTADASDELVWQHAVDSVRELCDEALPLGVHICVENVWNRFLLTPLEMRRFLDTVDRPNVRAYVDVGNLFAFGFPQHWIDILNTRIHRVHVKDFRRSIGSLQGFCAPPFGELPWDEVAKALSRTGFSSWITAEAAPPSFAVQESLNHLCATLRSLFGRQPV